MTRRLWAVALLLIVLLLQTGAQAVGTVTVTTTRLSDAGVMKHSIAWVSDAAGAVSGNTASFSGLRIGYLRQIKFIPDGGGTAPTALYDVTFVDANGVDLLAGTGANLSGTASNFVRPADPLLWDGVGTLDLVVANAGISKGGTVVLYFGATAQ